MDDGGMQYHQQLGQQEQMMSENKTDNLAIWNSVCRPPKEALKTIGGGRLKGMTDVNPQWRLKIMTEVFGLCGMGWHYEIIRLWTEPGANGEVMAFAHIHLFAGGIAIPGVGGSLMVAKEKDGLRANDEAYKMAITDALSVAMKQIGVAADIYAGLWDGSKYREPQKPESSKSVGRVDYESLTEPRRRAVEGIAEEINSECPTNYKELSANERLPIAKKLFESWNKAAPSLPEIEEKNAAWGLLGSHVSRAIAGYKNSLKEEKQHGTN